MHPASNLSRIENAAFNIFTPEVSTRIGRDLAIEAEVSRFGADQYLIPRYFPGANYRLKSSSDVSLRPLMAVINGCIQHIDSQAKGGGNGFLISGIGGSIRLAKISSQANRREP
jgi:hypothetical protein